MTKPHLFFIQEKYCDCNPNHGLSNNEHNLLGSFESSLLGTYEVFYTDEYYLLYGQSCDEALIKRLIETKPDLIILSWFHRDLFYPSLETLKLIRSKLQVPMVPFWFDSINDLVMSWAELLVSFVDLSVILDSTTAYLKHTNHPEKYLTIWTPQDTRIFYNPNLIRDINISFAGTSNRPDRLSRINALLDDGINIYQTGGQREQRISIEEYSSLYQRSKIVLNCGYDRLEDHQYKGRIFEATLCGAMLLESENQETSKWFDPMIDYVPFTSTTDLIDKTRYYLENEDARKAIALRGHQKAKLKYTGDTFWKTLLEKLNLIDQKNYSKADRVSEIIYQTNQLEIGSEFPQSRAIAVSSLIQTKLRKFQIKALEIGSWKGQSTSVIASIIDEYSGTLFTVDHWKGSPRIKHLEETAKEADIFSLFKKNLCYLGLWHIVRPLMMESEMASKIFQDNFFDFIFIDGDHRFNEIKRDLLTWLPKIKDGGIICGPCAEGYYSKYSKETQQEIDQNCHNDYMTTTNGESIHPGIVKALYDIFVDKHQIVVNSDLWYYHKGNIS